MDGKHGDDALAEGEGVGAGPHGKRKRDAVACAHAEVTGGLAGEDDTGPAARQRPLKDSRPPGAALQVDVLDGDGDGSVGALHAPSQDYPGLGHTERSAAYDAVHLGRIDRIEGVEPHDEPVGYPAEQLLVAPRQSRKERVGHSHHADEYRQHGGESEESKERAPGGTHQVAERYAPEATPRQGEAADGRGEPAAARGEMPGPDRIHRLNPGPRGRRATARRGSAAGIR